MIIADDIKALVGASKVSITGIEAAYRITAIWANRSKSVDVPQYDFQKLVRSEGAARTELIRSLGL